jgi:hypothetical protein
MDPRLVLTGFSRNDPSQHLGTKIGRQSPDRSTAHTIIEQPHTRELD